MIKTHCNYLSITAMIYAEQELQRKTENPAIGVVVSLDLAKIIGEVLEESKLNGLRLTVLRDVPYGFWMLYNAQSCIVSDI